MATDKQIAANRANALRSTGPKTAKSSRNALRHGLSLPTEIDADELAKFHTLEAALAGDRADEDRQRAVAEMARAQFELLRVRKIGGG